MHLKAAVTVLTVTVTVTTATPHSLDVTSRAIWDQVGVSTHSKATGSFLDRPFGGACRKVTLGGGGKVGMATLQGECVDGKGQWWETSLNLNQCVGDQDGRLAYQDGGNFDSKCRPCLLDLADDGDVDLKCNCLNGKGIPQYTSLRMGVHVEGALAVKPVNGVFVCGIHKGYASPAFE